MVLLQMSPSDLLGQTECGWVPFMATKRNTRPMTDEHKAALAEGREQGRKVRRYLDALEAHRPKRGRKRTPDSIGKRLARIEQELETADALKRVRLTQEQLDLQAELDRGENVVDLSALEEDFVDVAWAYSARKGITYQAWRSVGVEASVLKRAGINRSSN